MLIKENRMDYYNEMKSQAEGSLKVSAKNVQDCTAAISKIEKRFAEEMENVKNYENRIKVLNERASESLLSDTNSYEKYRTSITKLRAQLATSVAICTTFQNELLPAKKNQLAESKKELEKALTVFCESKRAACEKKMTELIGQVVAERDDFLDAVQRLFAENGLTFKLGRANENMPRPVHPRIDKMRPGCVILPLSLQERAKLPQRNFEEKPEKA
jgi:chromosome segregation ATPase